MLPVISISEGMALIYIMSFEKVISLDCRIGFVVVFRSKVPISGPNIAFYAAVSYLEKGQLGNLFSFQFFHELLCIFSHNSSLDFAS